MGQARKLFRRIALEKMGESGAEVARFLGVTMSSMNRPAAAPESPDPRKLLNALQNPPKGVMRKIMNQSTNRKSAVASTVREPEIQVPIGVRCVALLAVLVCANLPTVAFAQSPCPGIHVKILNIRNSTGSVACALFESPVGFPVDFLRFATNLMVIKIRDTQARCDFEDIPPGRYALAVIHDENTNGMLETNWLGIPTEGYGFSNDAEGVLGAPTFFAASFLYNGRTLHLTIGLHY